MTGSVHPELLWSGKYDDQGNLRPVERAILPFQVVETVNESKADREASQRDFFTKQAQDRTWRNRLIWGDNKVVMSSLLPELAGKIDLIYIDPPFATGQDFSFRAEIGDIDIEKLPSIIEERAYRDCEFSEFCPLVSLNSVPLRALTRFSPGGVGPPPR